MRIAGALCFICSSACASPLQRAAAEYESRSRYGIALAYLLGEPGSAEDGSRARVMAALLRTARDDREEAIARNDLRAALAANLTLLEIDPNDADARSEHARIDRALAERERATLDRMTERGDPRLSDLAECRRANAVAPNADSTERCQRLRQRLQTHAALVVRADNVDSVSRTSAAIEARLKGNAHDLIDVVADTDVNRNARLTVTLSPPSLVRDTGYVEVEHRGRHVMVATGKKEKVVTPPTKDEIEQAERDKKPRPESKTEERPLYQMESGEYRLYRRVVTVRVPYAYALSRDRDGVVATADKNEREEQSVSEYFEYTGSSQARSDPAGWPEGRDQARPVRTADSLRADAESSIPASVVAAVVAITEQE